MGWSGYDLYEGDCTFTTQLHLLKLAGIEDKYINGTGETIFCPTCKHEQYLETTSAYSEQRIIKLTEEHRKIVTKAYSKLVKYLNLQPPKPKHMSLYDMETWAIGWQMFADLIVNNKLPMAKQIKSVAKKANNWLASDEHCEYFDEPKTRCRYVQKFGKKLEKYKYKEK